MFFGAHLSSAGGIDKAADRAIEIGAEAVQVFVQSPRMWRGVNHKPENVARFKQRCDEGGLREAVTHAIYLINIASDDKELYRKSTDTLKRTMSVAEDLGLSSVIFHPGSHKTSGFDSCTKRLVKAVKETLKAADDPWLLLENSAGAGGTVGRTIDELARLIDLAGAPDRLGVCIDTCHWYVSGVDVTDPDVLDAELERFDRMIGLNRLRALHINDSKTPLGSNRDRHDNIGEGLLGKGLGTFLGHPKLQDIVAILEVPGENREGPNANEIKKVRAMHKRALAARKRKLAGAGNT
jgi:deoxyribonuclease-4